MHGNFGWLLYDELLCLNEFTMLFKDEVFNTFDLKEVRWSLVSVYFITELQEQL